MTRFPVEAGSEVVIFGLGPMGMSIVQGAKIQGAKTIIGVEPIRYRRELALKLGATHVLDPNEFTGNNGNDLVARIRARTPEVVPAGRRFLGERPAGPLFGFESTAQTQYALAPGIEAPPQGVDVFNQLYTSVRNGGYVQMAGAVRTSAGMLVGNKVVLSGNFPGIIVLRDLPRFVNLIEKGLFDAKGLIGRVYRPNQMLEAAQAAGNRSVISSVIDFT
jgi:Zn-dependent alcohol dehydrogenase